jgi:DNA-binding transcriptional regulator YbjK
LDNRPRRGRPPHPNRPNIIADAAVRVLAEEGSKGLSHRRVDREAGLPIGSTVHVASTRKDLFLTAARRLNDMTMVDIEAFAASIEQHETLTPELLAAEVMALWRRLTGEDQFFRLRAEMSVMFSQEFRGNVLEIYKPQLAAMWTFWQAAFVRLGCANARAAAMEFTLWNRGIFYVVAACESNLDELHHALIQRWIVDMIERLVAGEPGRPVPQAYDLIGV